LLILLLHQYDALVKDGFLDKFESRSFLITEVALEIFEHPKSDSSQPTVFSEANSIRYFF